MFSMNSDVHEPMLSSPSSPGVHQYLPGYLLGDSSSHAISPGPRLWSAGGQSPTHKSGSFTSPQAMSTTTLRGDMSRGKDKVGAPPVKSLFLSPVSDGGLAGMAPGHQVAYSSLPSTSRSSITPGPPTMGLFPGTGTPRVGDSFSVSSSKIPSSPAQIDPFYIQGDTLKSDDVLDETWVTIFGFPSAATSFILQQFAQYGNILKHVAATDGNWMHVHYQSKIQAKKALSKNGKIFGGSIMVGVLPCIDRKLMDDNKENGDVTNTPVIQNSFLAEATSARNTPIRPLTAAYQASRSDYEVLKTNQAPQRDNSFVSKVKEYVLGW